MDIKKCNQCGHIWTRRAEGEPISCPRCKRYDWKAKKVVKKDE
jgi:rubrerythrin